MPLKYHDLSNAGLARTARPGMFRGLRTASALKGSLAALALFAVPTIAAAQQECGPIVNGIVDCTTQGPVLPNGVHYDASDPQDLTVNFGQPHNALQVLTSSNDYQPVLGLNNFAGGGLIVNGTSSQIVSTNNTAIGALFLTPQDLTVNLGLVQTSGDYSTGVRALGDGNVSINIAEVQTSGAFSLGLYAGTMSASAPADTTISLSSGMVSTQGQYSPGIEVINPHGSTTISSGEVMTSGVSSKGIYSQASGGITITSGMVQTQGDNSTGITALTDGGDISVLSGPVNTAGNHSAAIYASTVTSPTDGNASMSVTSSGTLVTHGQDSNTIDVRNTHGDVTVSAENTITYGAQSNGIFTQASGNATVSAQFAQTGGEGSSGVTVVADGAISINLVGAQTTGDQSAGIAASTLTLPTAGNVPMSVSATSVTTFGQNSNAIDVRNTHGDVTVNAGGLVTYGPNSDSVYTVSSGNVAINAQYLATWGDNSQAIVGVANHGNITITGDTIFTNGMQSHGIAAAATGDVTISSSKIVTQGVGADGIYSVAGSGHTTIDAGSIQTQADGAAGIFAQSVAGQVDIAANSIQTSGPSSPAIAISTESGASNVTVNSITLNGTDSFGILVQSGPIICQYQTAVCTQKKYHQYYYGGAVTLNIGNILATGNYETAVLAESSITTLTLSGDLTALGKGSEGIKLTSYAGDRTIGEYNVDSTKGATTIHNLGSIATDGFGIQAFGGGGVTVDGGGDVKTYNSADGSDASAIEVFTNDHALTVQQHDIHTYGRNSAGIEASISNYGKGGLGEPHDINISIHELTTAGDLSPGILALNHTPDGAVNITLSGDLTTTGYGSGGVTILGGATGTVNLNVQNIATTGTHSSAISVYGADQTISVGGAITTAGNASHGVYALGNTLNLNVVGPIKASGIDSDGIVAQMTGDVTIAAPSVVATGYAGNGILVSGDNINLTAGTTESYNANAIVAEGGTSTNVTISGPTLGGYNGAIIAGGQVHVAVGPNAEIAGGVNGLVLEAAGPAKGDGSSNAPVSIIVDNAGVITGVDGYAIAVPQGVATINNTGRVIGAVTFSDGGDTFNNTGTFIPTGVSDFGAGTDVLNNTGIIGVGTGSTTATVVALNNLETLNNSGLIEMRNGHTGDVLSISGNYVASGNAKLGIDVGATTADQLVIGGTATGKTQLLLQGLSNATSRLAAPMVLIKAAGGSDPAAFTLPKTDFGLIHYSLKYVDGTGYGLDATAGAPVYHALYVSEGAEDMWRKSADAVTDELTSMRDAPGSAESPTGRVWGLAYGASDSKSNSDLTDIDVKTRQDVSGVQFGADLTRNETGSDRFSFGFTGGYAESNANFEASPEKAKITTLNFGSYLSLSHGHYFFDALGSVAQNSIELNDPVNQFDSTFSGTTYGLKTELGMRLGGGMFTYEPLATLSYDRSTTNNLTAMDQTIVFDPSETLRGTLGLRIAGKFKLSSGGGISYYASAAAVHDFLGENHAEFVSGALTQNLLDDDRSGFGRQVTLGATYQTARGTTFEATASGTYTKGYSSVSGRLGLRYRF
jgi:hypothetical protein